MKLADRILGATAIAVIALFGGADDAQSRTEISFWHAQEGKPREAIEALVQRFNQSQDEVEVTAVHKGTYPEVLTAAMVAHRRNTPPHIVQIYEVGTQSMAMSDAIVPVHRLMRQQKVAVDWSDFIETITGYYSTNDKLDSMPFNVSTPILYYNKDIFRKAGLPDKAPATWSDVEAASRKILATGAAKCGFTTPSPSWVLLENSFAWHDQPFATNQNGYTGLDTRLLINSDFGRMHIGAFVRWQKDRVFVYGGRQGTPNNLFVDGECAMVLQSSAYQGDYGSLAFGWGTGQLPHWGPPIPRRTPSWAAPRCGQCGGTSPRTTRRSRSFSASSSTPPSRSCGRPPRATSRSPDRPSRARLTTASTSNIPSSGRPSVNCSTPRPRQTARACGSATTSRSRESTIEVELESIFTGKKSVADGLDAAVNRGNAILRQFGVTNGAAPSGEI